MRRYLLSAAIVSSMILAAGQNAAFAASITIDDSNPDETITFSVAQFEGGVTLNGNPFQPASLTDPVSATTTFIENGPFSFVGSWLVGANSDAVFAFAAFDDDGSLSDTFVYTITADVVFSTISGTFCSEPDTAAWDCWSIFPAGIVPRVVDEGPNAFSNVFLDGVWTSDTSEPASTAPEPTSMALLGVGLAGIGFIRGRQGGRALAKTSASEARAA